MQLIERLPKTKSDNTETRQMRIMWKLKNLSLFLKEYNLGTQTMSIGRRFHNCTSVAEKVSSRTTRWVVQGKKVIMSEVWERPYNYNEVNKLDHNMM